MWMNNIFNVDATISEIFSVLEKFKNKVAFLIDDDGVLTGSDIELNQAVSKQDEIRQIGA